MATTAVRNANTVYLSSASAASAIDALTAKNTSVLGIILTAGGTAGTLTLTDVTTTSTKLVAAAAASTTVFIPLADSPIQFPNGINVSMSHVDIKATLIVQGGGG